jgi:DNA polymerase-4
VDLDAFFVEVCRQHLPEVRDEPLLIVGGRRDGRGVVQSASYGCRAYGVRAGMPSAQAARLCPGAVFVKGDFAWYRAASRAVRGIFDRFSPIVAMAGLDEGYLDFTGTEAMHPVSLLPVAERLRATVKQETGLDCSIGIGPNRMVAKLGSDRAKPRGVLEVREGWEAGFVAGLELKALPGIGPRTAARLTDLGLVGAWQVQAMPLPDLERLIGPAAKELHRRAFGHGPRTLRAERTARSMSRETTLAQDVRDPALLERTLAALTARVAAQLRDERLHARTVTLKLRHDDFTTVTRRRTLPQPSDLDEELFDAARALFRTAFAEVRGRDRGVRLIGVAATNLQAAVPADLFEPPEREKQRRLAAALDRVRGRFGFDAVAAGRQLAPAPSPDPKEQS